MEEGNNAETIMLPLEEIFSVRWTESRRNQLKKLRGKTSLASLAQKLNEKGVSVSRQYLYRLETDAEVRGISPDLLLGLCSVLEVSMSKLLCLKSQKIVQLGVDMTTKS